MFHILSAISRIDHNFVFQDTAVLAFQLQTLLCKNTDWTDSDFLLPFPYSGKFFLWYSYCRASHLGDIYINQTWMLFKLKSVNKNSSFPLSHIRPFHRLSMETLEIIMQTYNFRGRKFKQNFTWMLCSADKLQYLTPCNWYRGIFAEICLTTVFWKIPASVYYNAQDNPLSFTYTIQNLSVFVSSRRLILTSCYSCIFFSENNQD